MNLNFHQVAEKTVRGKDSQKHFLLTHFTTDCNVTDF